MKILGFGSRRDDHNTIKCLQDGEKPITLPKARQLHSALENSFQDTTKQNLLYLLAVASSNQYGLSKNSALRRYLEENSEIGNGQIANNDWESLLQKPIAHTLHKMPKSRRVAFEDDYSRIFLKPRELTKDEKKLLKYREYITKSKPIKLALSDLATKELTNKSLKYMDYFIASSEISMGDKVYVLSKLAYMLSNKYKINPQLQDKKAQLFGEVINDLIVKVPDNPVLTTKDCSQRHHGSCAAISMARKALVYEDKKAYIDTVLSEVDASPYMEIYDVTKLLDYESDAKKYKNERAPKVTVDKADIDYKKALKDGYRIIDASVLNWMKIAGSIGDGTINLEEYYSFDTARNGFMDDTRIVRTLDREYALQHAMLRVLIKSNNLLEKYDKSKLSSKVSQQLLITNGQYMEEQKGKYHNEIRSIIDKIIPEQIDKKIKFIDSIYDIKCINVKNNDKELAKQILSLLNDTFGYEYSAQFARKTKSLVKPVREYVNAKEALDNLKSNTNKRINDAELLFQIGVAQRAVIAQSTTMPDTVQSLYAELGLPNRSMQIRNELKRMQKLAIKNPNSPYILDFQQKNNIKSEDAYTELVKYDKILNKEIPEAIDAILAIFNVSYKKILQEMVKQEIENVKSGKTDYMIDVCARNKMVPNAKRFEEKLNIILDKLDKASSDEELANIIDELGANNKNECIRGFVKEVSLAIIKYLQAGDLDSARSILNPQYRQCSVDEISTLLNNVADNVNLILKQEEAIADRINYPNAKTVILKGYESLGYILKKEDLDKLGEKFSKIDKFREARMYAKQKSDVYVGDIYKFTDEQKRYLKQIESNISRFRRDVKSEYKQMNIELKQELEKTYEELGKRKGFFWIGEEGHSGLYDSESVRVIEQMTGRPYYIEKDPNIIVEKIKSGEGSGASSTMVSYDEYSGHAQYIADVKPVQYRDKKTGKLKTADVLLHDNTWGHREFRDRYVDETGVFRTDYGNGYGGKKGFVLDKSGLAGEFVADYKFDNGVDRTDRTTKAIEGPWLEIDKEEGYFPIIGGARIPGIDPRIKEKASKILTYLINIQNKEKAVDEMFEALEKVKDSARIDSLDKGDEALCKLQEALVKKIGGNGYPKMSIEEFNKLPVNDPIRIIIDKIIIRKAIYIPENDGELEGIKTRKGLEIYKKNYLDDIKEAWLGACAKKLDESSILLSKQIVKDISDKMPRIQMHYGIDLIKFSKKLKTEIENIVNKDENIAGDEFVAAMINRTSDIIEKDNKINVISGKEKRKLLNVVRDALNEFLYSGDMDDIEDNPKLSYIIKFIDSQYNPASNEELLDIFYSFINMPKNELKKIFSKISFKNIGIKFDTPENVLKMIQAGNSLEEKRFDDESRKHYFNDFIPVDVRRGKFAVSKKLADFNTKYRCIDVEVSNVGGEKLLNENRDIAFWKYKARPAIPNVQIKSDEDIRDIIDEKLQSMMTTIVAYRNYQLVKRYLINLENVNLAIDNRRILENTANFKKAVDSLLMLAKADTNMPKSIVALNEIQQSITAENIDYGKLKQLIDIVNADRFAQLETTTLESTEHNIESAKQQLRSQKNIVQINVLPKFQSKVAHLLNIWLKSVAQNPNTDDNEITYKAVLDEMVKHHVLKEPGELLPYTVKYYLKRPHGISDHDYDEVKKGLKDFLVEAYQKANKTNLEYKLMKAARAGFAVKIKDFIKDNTIVSSDGKENPVLADEGIQSIIDSLADMGTNHETLMLFVEQTGLVDRLMEAIYNTDIKKTKEDFLYKAKAILSQQHSQEKINEIYEKIEATIPDGTIFTDKKQIDDVYQKLAEAFSKAEYNRRNLKSLSDFYVENFKKLLDNSDVEYWRGKPLKDVIHYGLHYILDEKIGEGLVELGKRYSQAVNDINAKIDILRNVRLAENSAADKKRDEYIAILEKISAFGVKMAKYANMTDKNEAEN